MNKKIKIVQPLPPPNYGPSVYTEHLIKSLSKNNNVEILNVELNKSASQIGKKQYSKLWSMFKILKKLNIFKNSIVFINLHLKPSGLFKTALLTLFCSSKNKNNSIIFFLHEGGVDKFSKSNKIYIFILKNLLKKSTKVVALDPIQMDEWKKYYPGFNYVYLPAYREKVINSTPVNERSKTILFLSNLIPDKGIFDIVKIWNEINDKKNYELIISGNSTDKKILSELERVIKVSESVKLKTQLTRQEVLNQFSESKIFVMPTYYSLEQQPAVLIEALNYKLPIVAYDWRGISFMVQDNFNGFLVKPGNLKNFASKLQQLIDNDELIKDFSKNSEELFDKKFSINSYKSSLLSIIDEI